MISGDHLRLCKFGEDDESKQHFTATVPTELEWLLSETPNTMGWFLISPNGGGSC